MAPKIFTKNVRLTHWWNWGQGLVGWSLECLQMCNVFYQWRSINCSRGSSIRCWRSEWSYPTRRTRMSNHQRHNHEVQVQGEIWIGFPICASHDLQIVFYAPNLVSAGFPSISLRFANINAVFRKNETVLPFYPPFWYLTMHWKQKKIWPY